MMIAQILLRRLKGCPCCGTPFYNTVVLEVGVFKLPRPEGAARAVELRVSELAMILDGIDVSRLARVARYARPVGQATGSG